MCILQCKDVIFLSVVHFAQSIVRIPANTPYNILKEKHLHGHMEKNIIRITMDNSLISLKGRQ